MNDVQSPTFVMACKIPSVPSQVHKFELSRHFKNGSVNLAAHSFSVPAQCKHPHRLHLTSALGGIFQPHNSEDSIAILFSEGSPTLHLQLYSRDLISGLHREATIFVWLTGFQSTMNVTTSYQFDVASQSSGRKKIASSFLDSPVVLSSNPAHKTEIKVPILGDGVHELHVYAVSTHSTQGSQPKAEHGDPVLRSVQLTFPVLKQTCLPALTHDAALLLPPSRASQDFWDILIKAQVSTLQKCADSADVRVSAELWTSNNQGIAQLSTISSPTQPNDEHAPVLEAFHLPTNDSYYMLSFHISWLLALEIMPWDGLQLRNISLYDRHTHIKASGIDSAALVDLSGVHKAAYSRRLSSRRLEFPFSFEIQRAMLHGPIPEDFKDILGEKTKNNPAQVLISHGYCASTPPFPAEDFENAIHFVGGYNEAVSNDQLTRELLRFASQKNATKYSMIAHSQGGLAALHMYTYYWSGLDALTQVGEQSYRIQTLSSPFQGTPLMDHPSLVNLLSLLGVFCGYTSDLSEDGASAWLASIPKDRRNGTTFYTIWNGEGQRACVLPAEIFFGSSDDGATEIKLNELEFSSGPAEDNPKFSWCHSTGMNHEAGYLDHTRNKLMNKRVARF